MTWRSSEDDEKPAPLPCAISGKGEGSGGGRSDGHTRIFEGEGCEGRSRPLRAPRPGASWNSVSEIQLTEGRVLM